MYSWILCFQAPRAEVVLVLSRSRSVTPADRSYDLIDAATYNFINSSRPPKILESPLDSKSLSAGRLDGLRKNIAAVTMLSNKMRPIKITSDGCSLLLKVTVGGDLMANNLNYTKEITQNKTI